MAFEDAFTTWEGKLMPHLSEWRPINTFSMSLRLAAQGHTFQSTINSPAWMDLVHRSRGRGLVSKKGVHNPHWDLLSMAISQVEPNLKPYDTYLPPLNLHRVQDAPLNNLDGGSQLDAASQTGGNGRQGMWQFGIFVHSEHFIPRENEVSFGSL